MSYTTALEDDKELAIAFGIDGKISEKSFKVSGVSEAFNRGISLEDAMWHGRWVGVGTPAIYCHLNKKKDGHFVVQCLKFIGHVINIFVFK